jgi:CubicO group peptidase (beta-lactamase class C family)
LLEAYTHPYRPETRNSLFSVTKSVISTLVGIAIDEGKIAGVHERVLDYFPGVKAPDNALGTGDMTVEHLLMLSSGHEADSEDAVSASTDWATDFFARPFANKPGEVFLYDSGASHMLSLIISKATGRTTDDYAREKLFGPLGITDYYWESTAEGVYVGGWGLKMTACDMAKFGYLILNKGNWRGRRIVSESWVETATSRHIAAKPEGNDAGYGYHWWMDESGGFCAAGFADQRIFILPRSGLVAVLTFGITGSDEYAPGKLLSKFILPAIKSDTPLPEDAGEAARLHALIPELADPAPQAQAVLPAAGISGCAFAFDCPVAEFSLDFSGQNDCILTMAYQGNRLSLPVGLDGVARVTETPGLIIREPKPPRALVALRGRWEEEATFAVEMLFVGDPFQVTFRFTFNGPDATLTYGESIAGYPGLMKTNEAYQGKKK